MSTGCKLNKIYSAGYCIGRGIFADRTLGWEKKRFYTRCFLIEHPKKGLILVDTGYGQALVKLAQRGIYSLYKNLLPFTFSDTDSVVTQLAHDGISLNDLSYLIITHFHPDHIGALPEFANVPWIYREDSLHSLLSFSLLRGLRKGFIRLLVPSIPKRSIPIKKAHFTQRWSTFLSYDVFGDQSLYLVDLPGHALGQTGVVIQDAFIVADAAWGGNALPNIFGLLIQENISEYRNTFNAIQALDNSIQVHPTHKIETHE